MAKLTPTIRPGAGGHRFGPSLRCAECGTSWDEHQADPSPCSGAQPEAAPLAERLAKPVIVAAPAPEDVPDD